MSYRNRGSRFNSRSSRRNNRFTTGNGQRDYGSEQSGMKRHEFLSQIYDNNLPSGDFIEISLARFKRSFSVSPDSPDTPTASNNYQTEAVMNGSKIVNYATKLLIKNNQTTAGSATTDKSNYINIYQIAVSFYDAHTWNALQNANCPVDFDTSSDDEGEVDFKAIPITLTANAQKNSKFAQHYMQLVARLMIPAGQQQTININRIPPKCRRSNSGMFWGLCLHNDSILNNNETIPITVAQETSFNEIPADNRLPWLY